MFRKYKDSIIALGFIAAIFWVYLQVSNYQKMKCAKQILEVEKQQDNQTIQQQEKVIKNNEDTIKAKINQQKIVSKPDIDNNTQYRLRWLQTIWEEQSASSDQ